MPQYMLDTNICIYVMKNHPPKLRERFNRLAEQLCISSITLAELYFGAEKSRKREENIEAIEHFTARLDILPFPARAASHHGEIRAELERGGKPIGANDLLIGAHARAEGLIVVTNNTREFRRLPDVRVENWVS
jgi:tRNA(fMet)-specific endonuclease VapC